MTTCDPSSMNEKSQKKPAEKPNGACAIDPADDLFTEHDVDYILSQLIHPVDRQLIRDTLTDNQGDIDGTITFILTLDIPSTPSPQPTNEPIERIMMITGVHDVELVQQSYAMNNCDIDATIESLLKLNVDDYEEVSDNEQPAATSTTKKTRPVPNRQAKADKKKAKKDRAMEKHRAKILEEAGKTSTKQESDGKSDSTVNPDQQPVNPPADMEFIRI